MKQVIGTGVVLGILLCVLFFVAFTFFGDMDIDGSG